MHKAIAELLLGSVLLLAGCHKQPQRVLVVPPPAPAARPAPPADLPPPPQVETPAQPAATLPPATAEVPPAPPAPAAPKAKRPSRSKRDNSPAPAVVEAPAPAVAPAPDPPQLGEVLSQQDMRRMNADLDRAMRNAQAVLRSLTGKVLTAQQQAAAEQAASFLRQAVEVRSQDLASARSLAQRAEVIARDLASSVR
ncbi:MAG TPA: hypothetical protein VKG25_05670 [Bryobacteraceae bacterium]|nr:hypothetical protein [Bryobacteraceae bacterium]